MINNEKCIVCVLSIQFLSNCIMFFNVVQMHHTAVRPAVTIQCDFTHGSGTHLICGCDNFNGVLGFS